LQVAREITRPQAGRLSQALRSILAHAVKRGGSTLRDYRDAFNKAGTAAQLHAVYGRAGQPCACCGHLLIGTRLQGRATVFCPCCQDLSTIPRALPR
jgi:formamidopyrimidine-DNA glycosylase